LAKNYAVLEIAPDPNSMLSYTEKMPKYGKSSANMLQGPMELTHHLAKLDPGEHTMEFSVASYGLKFSSSFTIEGSDFGFYAELNQKMVAARFKHGCDAQGQNDQQILANQDAGTFG
jgi:hypothetical protein